MEHTELSLVTLLVGVDGDSTKSTTIQVLAFVLDHPLSVRASDSKGVGLRAPRAVPVNTTNCLPSAGVDDVETTGCARGGIRSTAGVDLELLAGSNNVSLDGTLSNFMVLITCNISNIELIVQQVKIDMNALAVCVEFAPGKIHVLNLEARACAVIDQLDDDPLSVSVYAN